MSSPSYPMVLKSNRSSLWRHIIGTCRRLRWLCRKHSEIVARHDKTPVKSTFLSRDTNLMSRRSDIMLQHLYRSFNTCTFSLTTCAMLRHTTKCFAAVVRYIIKHLFYETAWSILFWSHKDDVTSLVKVHREYSPAARILHTKFDIIH